jgi:pimeloyl-ACP methyl ester carboxylesterase
MRRTWLLVLPLSLIVTVVAHDGRLASSGSGAGNVAPGGGNPGEGDLTAVRSYGPPQPSVEDRDIVFIRGIDSQGNCDQAERWLEEYLESATGRSFFGLLRIGRYLHFNYQGGGSYDCPRSQPAYMPVDTCDGVAKAATELKELIDTQATAKVTVVAHSMGGLISAYLVATNGKWASSHIASVVTFDSPLRGLSEAMQWGELLLTECTGVGGNPVDSLAEMGESGEVVRDAAAAANTVPFYALDATQVDVPFLNIELVPRDRASLSGGRAFRWATGCDQPAADPGTCDPPAPVDDDHTSVWSCRFDESVGLDCPARGVDKAFLVGCAAAAAVDCVSLSVTVSDGATAEARVAVVPAATRARFISSFDGSVRMTLSAPDGTVYGPDGAGPVAGFAAGATSEVYEIDRPAPGLWTVELFAADVATEGEEVLLALLTMDNGTGPAMDTGDEPDVADKSPEAPASTDTNVVRLLVIVAAVAVGASVLGAAAWYARRR